MARRSVACLLLLAFAVASCAAQEEEEGPLPPDPDYDNEAFEAYGYKIPLFPNNLVVFPDRGTRARTRLEVRRRDSDNNNKFSIIAGAAICTVGELGSFEVNHPGGACWGNGTNVKVTPNIQGGDLVQLRLSDGEVISETLVQEAYVEKTSYSGGTEFVIEGHLGATGASTIDPTAPLASLDWLENRIINPDWKDTAVARRDARALNGPLVTAPKGGYLSGMESGNGAFKATYNFDDASLATIATAGTSRIMSWQFQDAAGNRQGLTISEFREMGGPGLGGCPAGPNDVGAPAGTFSYVKEGSSYKVTWAKAKAVSPDAPLVLGYTVLAINQAASSYERALVGRQIDQADKTTCTITVPDASAMYDIVVRSQAGSPSAPHASDPFTRTRTANLPTSGEQVPPEVYAEDAGNNKVTLRSVPATGVEMYYSIGEPVLDGGDSLSIDAISYEGPINLAGLPEDTIIYFVGFDANNLVSQDETTVSPTGPTEIKTTPQPDASGTFAGQAQITLKWTSSDPDIKGYEVHLYAGSSAALNSPYTTTEKTLVIKNLVVGTSYYWTVAGVNGGEGSTKRMGEATAKQGPLKPTAVTDKIAIVTAKFKQGKEFRVTGTASTSPVTITLYRANNAGTAPGASIAGATTNVLTAAPTGGFEWEIRIKAGAVLNSNPGPIFAKSSSMGVAGPITPAALRRRRMLA